ncbi:MAG: hypothetical protein RR382_00365 [Tannerellaceae bacterium]
MSTSYLPSKGTVVKLTGDAGSSSMYRVDGLRDKLEDAFVITNVLSSESDIIAQVATVDDYRVLYTFGKAFGSITITGILFLGGEYPGMCGKGKPGAVKALYEWFDEVRVSKTKKPIVVSCLGSERWKVYIVSTALMRHDASFNTIEFSITGAIAPNPK